MQVISPLATGTGRSWASLDAFKLIFTAFFEGRNGYKADLSDHQWHEFGTTLKGHPLCRSASGTDQTHPAGSLLSPVAQDRKGSPGGVDGYAHDDTISAKLTAFFNSRRDEILDLVKRAERLSQSLQARSQEFIVCHSDIHAGNVLIGANHAFFIVDWDNPVLARKERDLMFVGGDLMDPGHTPREEGSLCYQAYGETQVDSVALTYYPCERIVQDVAEFCG